jgi:hypothetical protein
VFELLRAIKGISGAEIARRAAKKGYSISGGTVCRWRWKERFTRYPQRYSCAAAAAAVNKSYALIDNDELASIKRARKQALKRRAERSNGAHASL